MQLDQLKINVLDHGFVRLVSYMQSAVNDLTVDDRCSVMDLGWSGDLEIVRNARVSYDADWRQGDDAGKDEKLLNYMMNNNHTSPFEAMTFTFEVKAPIFVFRQWHRHRTWSYNEVSARYAELPEEFYVPEIEHITTQHASNKQMRTQEQHPQAKALRQQMIDHNESAFGLYKFMLAKGAPRELARTVLPLATYSRMFATVNLHNLFRFISLRDHPHAQYEIQVYAQALQALIHPIVPISSTAFDNSRGKHE